MLQESLNGAIANVSNRMTAALARHQLPLSDPLDAMMPTIVGDLGTIVGAAQAAITVASTGGEQRFAFGPSDLLDPGDDESRPGTLVVASRDADTVATMVLARQEAPFFLFEREIIQSGLSALHRWITAALRIDRHDDRRRRFLPVDTLFDHAASDAAQAGNEASVIVISVDASCSRLMAGWIGTIRSQLRAGDFAGLLSNREMAILLCAASATDAAAVATRVKSLIAFNIPPEVAFRTAVGIASCSPGPSLEGSLVGAARARLAAQ
jgi:hypothetical protein